jgi:hypothetical protein
MAEEKKFKTAKDSDFPEELEVKIYNPGLGDVFGDLGLEDSRTKEIVDLICKYMISEDTITEATAKVSKHIRNANELFAVGMIVGRGIVEGRSKQTKQTEQSLEDGK